MAALSISRACQCRNARRIIFLAACAGLLGCRAPAEPEAEKKVAPPAAEAERLHFALPAEFVPVELRGEGSETLRAPAAATVRSRPGRIQVQSGADFAVDIELQPQLSQLPAVAEGARRVMQESDLVVFETGGGYWFLMLRELVPEWDESDRRRILCSSAGAVQKGSAPEPRRFDRAAVERMVAACRSVALPRLD